LFSRFLSLVGLNEHEVEWECKIVIPYVRAFSQIQHNHIPTLMRPRCLVWSCSICTVLHWSL